MHFRLLHDDATGAVSYLLGDPAAGEAVLIDPREADGPVIRALLAEYHLRLRWVLRTHDHAARLGGGRVGAAPRGFAGLNVPIVERVAPREGVVAFGEEIVHVLSTPGHTDHCLSFRWRDRLFCGAVLAVDACPVQPWPVRPEALWDSVHEQVFTLPPETLLFSGHARRRRAASTVFEERRWHPWFGTTGRDEFLARVAATARQPYAHHATRPPCKPS
jgi:glyoxylase-like metal-dependent hydrolase (beta-lactamase superfamily II)